MISLAKSDGIDIITLNVRVGNLRARKVYFSDGPVEIPDEYIKPILGIVKLRMTVPAQKALNELLTNE